MVTALSLVMRMLLATTCLFPVSSSRKKLPPLSSNANSVTPACTAQRFKIVFFKRLVFRGLFWVALYAFTPAGVYPREFLLTISVAGMHLALTILPV